MVTKTKCVNESKLVATEVNPSPMRRLFPICHRCDEVGHIQPKCWLLQNGKNDTLKGQFDRMVIEANTISQLVQSSSSNHVKQALNGSRKFMINVL